MKKIIISLALALFLFNVYAQEKKETSEPEKQVNAPEAVKKAFVANYPAISKVKWSLEKQGEYEAEFELNKAEMSVLYDENGMLVETETVIKDSDLPEAVKSALTKDFAGYKITEIEKTDAKGVVTYEIEAKKGNLEYELIFDANGRLLKQKEEKDID